MLWRRRLLGGCPPGRLSPRTLAPQRRRRSIWRFALRAGIDPRWVHVGYLDAHAKDEDPSFLYLNAAKLHEPNHPHPDFVGKSMANLLGNMHADPDAATGRLVTPDQVWSGQARKAHPVLPGLRCALRVNIGCPKDRFATSPLRRKRTALPPSSKSFFHRVDRPMRIMADLLAADRAPA